MSLYRNFQETFVISWKENGKNIASKNRRYVSRFKFFRQYLLIQTTGSIRVVYIHILGSIRTKTTTLLTTTGSELQCTAQARPVNFVVVSSTTPNKVESPRPAIHKLRQIQIHCFKQFLKSLSFSYPRKSRHRSFFPLTGARC